MKDEWIEWLQDKQRHFFYGITLVVASFFVAFQLFGKFHKPTHNKTIAASHTVDKWLAEGESFDKLESVIKKNPELETKFGAMIADKFIVQNDGDKAEPFASSVFQRIHKQAPNHTAFAKGSLLIAKGQLQEALTESMALKDKTDHDALLFGFNLVRIASLYRALETPQKERETLEELETYLQTHEKAATVLSECFHEGNMTLTDYIQQRKINASQL